LSFDGALLGRLGERAGVNKISAAFIRPSDIPMSCSLTMEEVKMVITKTATKQGTRIR